MAKDFSWLQIEHPVYESQKPLWERNERRFYGGDAVLNELRPFDWEARSDQPSARLRSEAVRHYEDRKLQATYINFVDLFARTMVGHLMRHAPQPDEGLSFGTLGAVSRADDNAAPTQAELVYYNADGVGNDGSQWDNFWAACAMQAMVTGHRWIMCEAPPVAPENRAEEEEGQRPYLVHLSPLSVTNWHYEEGHLQWAVVKISKRKPVLDKSDGSMKGNEYEDQYLLLVREGWLGFGDDFRGGGWWLFGNDLEPAIDTDPDTGERTVIMGDWEKTGGEIPLWPLFYERAEGTAEVTSMARPGTTEIGQAAVSYMNLSSAADYDVWDAAQSVQYVLGADVEGYNLATEKLKQGSKLIPFPANKRSNEPPTIHDGSLGAVVAEVFETRLTRKLAEVEQLAALEASGTPDASGESKRVGFADVKSPRLALMASELEQAQNTAIHFLEMRFGNPSPTGVVSWPEEFELLPVIDSIRELFEVIMMTDIKSRSLEVKAILAAAKAKGLIVDDEEEALIEGELQQSARELEQEANRDTAVLGQETQALIQQANAEAEQAAGTEGTTGLQLL